MRPIDSLARANRDKRNTPNYFKPKIDSEENKEGRSHRCSSRQRQKREKVVGKKRAVNAAAAAAADANADTNTNANTNTNTNTNTSTNADPDADADADAGRAADADLNGRIDDIIDEFEEFEKL
jgi:hypothetical protein